MCIRDSVYAGAVELFEARYAALVAAGGAARADL